jgi:hypothetical protein
MIRTHSYDVTVVWTGNRGSGTADTGTTASLVLRVVGERQAESAVDLGFIRRISVSEHLYRAL